MGATAAAYPVLTSILGGTAASMAIGQIMKPDTPQTPAAPKVEAPPVMPLPDDEAAKAARKKSIMAQQQRSGRMSTILTDNSGSDTLGA